jgi:hypothetical protein
MNDDDMTELRELSARRRQNLLALLQGLLREVEQQQAVVCAVQSPHLRRQRTQRQWVILSDGGGVKQIRALITLYADKKAGGAP